MIPSQGRRRDRHHHLRPDRTTSTVSASSPTGGSWSRSPSEGPAWTPKRLPTAIARHDPPFARGIVLLGLAAAEEALAAGFRHRRTASRWSKGFARGRNGSSGPAAPRLDDRRDDRREAGRRHGRAATMTRLCAARDAGKTLRKGDRRNDRHDPTDRINKPWCAGSRRRRPRTEAHSSPAAGRPSGHGNVAGALGRRRCYWHPREGCRPGGAITEQGPWPMPPSATMPKAASAQACDDGPTSLPSGRGAHETWSLPRRWPYVQRLPVLLGAGAMSSLTAAPIPVLQQTENFADGQVSANDCFRPVSRLFRPHPAARAAPGPRWRARDCG